MNKIQCPPQGVYENIPAAQYHAWDAISSTFIKRFASNPFTSRDAFVASDDVNVGSGVHSYVLEGITGLYRDCAIMPPECDGTSKAAREARALFAVHNPGKTPLPPFYGSGGSKLPIMDVLNGVDRSLKTHPTASTILAESKKEVSLVWRDDTLNGCFCKARVDVLHGSVLFDLKKVRKISGLQYEMDKGFRYRLQAAHYMNAAEALGLKPIAFGFIACEAFYPFEVKVFYSDPEKTEQAQHDVKNTISLMLQSKENGYWPNLSPPVGLDKWENLNPDDLIDLL